MPRALHRRRRLTGAPRPHCRAEARDRFGDIEANSIHGSRTARRLERNNKSMRDHSESPQRGNDRRLTASGRTRHHDPERLIAHRPLRCQIRCVARTPSTTAVTALSRGTPGHPELAPLASDHPHRAGGPVALLRAAVARSRPTRRWSRLTRSVVRRLDAVRPRLNPAPPDPRPIAVISTQTRTKENP